MYEHPVKGYNSRLDALQATILSVKLKKLSAWNSLRKSKAEWYNKNLKHLPIILPMTHPLAEHVYYLYVIQTSKRDELQKYLESQGIHTAVHYPLPIHLQPAYKELGYKPGAFPVSEKAAKQILSLPFFPHITSIEQQRVVEGITSFFNAKNKSKR
jgi:dTDP-4-amino-4,6-dideoxygalactose transaminase